MQPFQLPTPILSPLPSTFRISATHPLHQCRVLQSTAISTYHANFEPRRRIMFGMRDDRQWRAGVTGVEIVGGKSMADARLAPLQMPHDRPQISDAYNGPSSNISRNLTHLSLPSLLVRLCQIPATVRRLSRPPHGEERLHGVCAGSTEHHYAHREIDLHQSRPVSRLDRDRHPTTKQFCRRLQNPPFPFASSLARIDVELTGRLIWWVRHDPSITMVGLAIIFY